MARTAILPYKILASLLYAEFDFMERETPLVVVPTKLMCKQLGIVPKQLKMGFEHLYQAGLIEEFTWHKYHTTVRVKPPIDMNLSREEKFEIA